MRLKLLLRFFTNAQAYYHLRGLAEEFGNSTNAVRTELMKLEEAGLLESQAEGKRILYRANSKNPFYRDLVKLVGKHLGFEAIAERILERLGDVEAAYIFGDYAKGFDSGTIEVLLLGDVDQDYLEQLKSKLENEVGRQVNVTVTSELPKYLEGIPFIELIPQTNP
jgi:DNA-binding transcriptional ArsR family regulator